MPLGVNSNFRYWGEGITPYMQKAKGAHLWDVDGNQYIDYRMAFGPIILGHAYDEVNAKVAGEIELGTMSAMTYELEIEVAEMMVKMCPGLEMVRFACSGTEATMHASGWRVPTPAVSGSSSSRGCTTAFRITRFGPPTLQWKPMGIHATRSRFRPVPAFHAP